MKEISIVTWMVKNEAVIYFLLSVFTLIAASIQNDIALEIRACFLLLLTFLCRICNALEKK